MKLFCFSGDTYAGSAREEIELKPECRTAIEQIKEKNYPESLQKYTGNILLVGVNYDKKTKEHQCMIERYEKNEETEIQ